MQTRPILTFCATLLGVVLALTGAAVAQPDIIVADIPGTFNWGSANNIAAFSCGSNACNIGNAIMSWDGNNNQHPVIAENMFRLKGGRIEQLGQAWVKHGFASANSSYCQTCQTPGTQLWIGVGCSDPYGNQQNGVQTDLAPKSEVNAATGYFPIPYNGTPAIPPVTGRRLQARHVDLDPTLNAGAIYFIEVQYVAPGDIGHNFNNASYRRVNVTPNGTSYNISFTGTYPTQAQKAGDPGVEGPRSERRDRLRRRPERWPLHHGIPRDGQRERHDALRVRDPQPVLGPLAARTLDRDAGGRQRHERRLPRRRLSQQRAGRLCAHRLGADSRSGLRFLGDGHVRNEPRGERAALGNDVQLPVRLEPAAWTRDLHAVQAGHSDDDAGADAAAGIRGRDRGRRAGGDGAQPDAGNHGQRDQSERAARHDVGAPVHGPRQRPVHVLAPHLCGRIELHGYAAGDGALPDVALVREPDAARRRRSDRGSLGSAFDVVFDRGGDRRARHGVLR